MRNTKNIKLHIKKGDTVKVITGNHRNSTGEVLQVFPQENRAIVKGINLAIKHVKPTKENPKGGRIKKEAKIHISNLMFVDPSTQNASRIGRRENSKGVLERYAKKTNKHV